MTEDDARTKWCPQARVLSHGQTGRAGFNRHLNGDIATAGNCLGSGCMMWRWANEVTGRGFCGLAGAVGLSA